MTRVGNFFNFEIMMSNLEPINEDSKASLNFVALVIVMIKKYTLVDKFDNLKEAKEYYTFMKSGDHKFQKTEMKIVGRIK